MDDATNLAERTEALYRRLSDFPEAQYAEGRVYLKTDAHLALLDLRQLLEREIIPALYRMDKR